MLGGAIGGAIGRDGEEWAETDRHVGCRGEAGKVEGRPWVRVRGRGNVMVAGVGIRVWVGLRIGLGLGSERWNVELRIGRTKGTVRVGNALHKRLAVG